MTTRASRTSTPPPQLAGPILAWTVPLSGVLHAFLVLLALGFGLRGGCHFLGGTGQQGGDGVFGNGGTAVEMSIEGAPAIPVPAAAPHAATQATPTPTTPTPVPPPTPPPQPRHTAPRILARVDETENSQNTDPELERRVIEPLPEVQRVATPEVPDGGTSGQQTSGSRRGASVAEQRALLPRAVFCDDPVAGVWRAHRYDPLYGDWMLATLHVHRDGPTHLRGVIVVHAWEGGGFDVRPPPCGEDGFDFIVEMPGDGQIRGERVEFGGTSWRLRTFRCNSANRMLTYNPDHFSGTINPAIQEFQSVNNDGGRARNEAMVFRRVQCEPGE